MNSFRSGCPCECCHCIAIFIATSTDTDPESAKKTYSILRGSPSGSAAPGAIASSFCPKSTAGRCVSPPNITCDISPACRARAAPSLG